jgi:ribosomal RNA-processing protein 12
LPVILALPRLNSPFLTGNSYTLLHLLFSTSPDAFAPRSLLDTLNTLLSSRPDTRDERTLPGWLEGLEAGLVALARQQPAEAQRIVGEQAPDLLGLLTSDSATVRAATTSALNAMVRYGLTDADVQNRGTISQLASLVLDALKSVRYRASEALPHLLTVVANLISRARLRTESEPVAVEVFREHVELVGELRGNEKFAYKEKAEEVLGMAIEVCGPAWVLDVLPFNVEDIRYGYRIQNAVDTQLTCRSGG